MKKYRFTVSITMKLYMLNDLVSTKRFLKLFLSNGSNMMFIRKENVRIMFNIMYRS